MDRLNYDTTDRGTVVARITIFDPLLWDIRKSGDAPIEEIERGKIRSGFCDLYHITGSKCVRVRYDGETIEQASTTEAPLNTTLARLAPMPQGEPK
jgi:hypothetical protein